MAQIAVIAPEQHEPFIEGIQKSARATIKELISLGHLVSVFSQYSYGEKIADVNYVFSANKNKFAKYLSWFKDARKVTREILKNNPEKIFVFSLDWSFLSTLLLLKKQQSSAKITIFIFSTRETGGLSGKFIASCKNSEKITFWCFSQTIAGELRKLGISPEKITTSPVFFTQPKAVTPHKPKEANRQRIGYMSSSETGAGIDTMLFLAQQLPEDEIVLAIRNFGERDEARDENLLSKTQTFKNVAIERNLADVPDFLSGMDVLVLPPKNTGSTMAIPLVALEAKYAGCQVFVADLPSLRELKQLGVADVFKDDTELLTLINKQKANTKAQEISRSLPGFLSVKEFVIRITL